MNFFPWDDRFLTHVSRMDSHHRKLIDLINALYDGVFACENIDQERELTKRVIDELIHYGEYHFEAEERLMRENDYPGYEEQKQYQRV